MFGIPIVFQPICVHFVFEICCGFSDYFCFLCVLWFFMVFNLCFVLFCVYSLGFGNQLLSVLYLWRFNIFCSSYVWYFLCFIIIIIEDINSRSEAPLRIAGCYCWVVCGCFVFPYFVK